MKKGTPQYKSLKMSENALMSSKHKRVFNFYSKH
jgi:hypothetical protein